MLIFNTLIMSREKKTSKKGKQRLSIGIQLSAACDPLNDNKKMNIEAQTTGDFRDRSKKFQYHISGKKAKNSEKKNSCELLSMISNDIRYSLHEQCR